MCCAVVERQRKFVCLFRRVECSFLAFSAEFWGPRSDVYALSNLLIPF